MAHRLSAARGEAGRTEPLLPKTRRSKSSLPLIKGKLSNALSSICLFCLSAALFWSFSGEWGGREKGGYIVPGHPTLGLGVLDGVVKGESATAKPFYEDIRLPTSIVPNNYTITLDVELEPSFSVEGEIEIDVDCREGTKLIVLHAKGQMVISKVALKLVYAPPGTAAQPLPRVNGIAIHEDHEQIQLQLSKELIPASRYSLKIFFRSQLSRSMEGFYRSSYLTPKGEKRCLGKTHFEPTSARMAFPCFDEPALKEDAEVSIDGDSKQMQANFSIILIHNATLKALSNMPAISTTMTGRSAENGTSGSIDPASHPMLAAALSKRKKITRFQTSVKMSTYLVAFIVSDFKHKSAKTATRGLPVSVWAPAHQIKQAEYALAAATRILDFYETYFELDFPLPKQ
eukprot:jgi/Bigna1/74584/fgenesh1_pg.29_\